MEQSKREGLRLLTQSCWW